MAEIILAAEPGRVTGSSASRRLRAQGRIPAVVYGGGVRPTSVTLEWSSLRQALMTERGINAVISLDIEGTRRPVIVKDLQRHPVRRDVLHVDLLVVDLDQEVATEVVIVLEGE